MFKLAQDYAQMSHLPSDLKPDRLSDDASMFLEFVYFHEPKNAISAL